jgi:hypothetical protein
MILQRNDGVSHFFQTDESIRPAQLRCRAVQGNDHTDATGLTENDMAQQEGRLGQSAVAGERAVLDLYSALSVSSFGLFSALGLSGG